MAGETGLGVGLGHVGAGEHVGNGALAGPGATDHDDVQRRGRLVVEIGADDVSHQAGGQAEVAGGAVLIVLLASVLFQPAEVIGQLAGQRPCRKRFHVRFPSPRASCNNFL
jgi:hypothetical protein